MPEAIKNEVHSWRGFGRSDHLIDTLRVERSRCSGTTNKATLTAILEVAFVVSIR